MNNNLNWESVKRGFLHLIRALFSNRKNSNIMTRTQKLFSKIEPNNCMTTAIRINNKHLLLLNCTTSLNDSSGVGIRRKSPWIYRKCKERWRNWERWRERRRRRREFKRNSGNRGNWWSWRRVERWRIMEERGWRSKSSHWRNEVDFTRASYLLMLWR